MKLNYMIADNGYITNANIHEGCSLFFNKFGTIPKVVHLPYSVFYQLMASNPQAGVTLQEVGKEYKQVIPIVGGFLELKLMPNEESVYFSTNNSYTIPNHSHGIGGTANTHTIAPAMPHLIIFENNEIDEQFEKQVLGKDV